MSRKQFFFASIFLLLFDVIVSITRGEIFTRFATESTWKLGQILNSHQISFQIKTLNDDSSLHFAAYRFTSDLLCLNFEP